MIITTEMIISGFVSKVVNDCGDILKNKIRDADKNRKAKEQTIETRIYQVIVDALNGFSYNEHKKEEMVYDAAESILKQFKSSENDYKEAVRVGLKIIVPQVTGSICEDFLEELCYEICMEENRDLAIEYIIHQGEQVIYQQKQTNKYMQAGFKESHQNEKEMNRKLDCLLERQNGEKVQNAEHSTKRLVANRAKEYADKWDKNVFLNDFNERDENAGINIKLKEIYLEGHLPHYLWKRNTKSSKDLKKLLVEYVVKNKGKKMLLVLGQAGIGKSTLITWMLANLIENIDKLFVYQFAPDLKNIDWQGDDILKDIFDTLNIGYDELENKVVIFDGFDEIYANSDREGILNKLNQEIIEMNILKNFTLIITCRENYVYELKKIECDYITLQAWDEEQIKSFCINYGVINRGIISQSSLTKILEKKEVFGVPLILYMVLALNISIEENGSIVDVYDQIFSIDRSGIYDRCIRNSRYGGEHRISEIKIKQQIHQISQRIAFWIFENNSTDAFITQKEYEEICDIVISETSDENEDIKRDFLIGNYFKLINHCDGVGTQELHFIHRSIYEYFVVVYFFESMYNLASDIAIAGKLGELLRRGKLSEQILQFIKYKFDSIKGYDLSKLVKEIFQLMLRDGMTYNIGVPCKNAMVHEMKIFFNMLEVVHLWDFNLGKLDDNMVSYLQYNYLDVLNLSGVVLKGADLSGVNLISSNLIGANLNGANLNGANLTKSYLNGADLIGARLNGANLNGANMNGANLRGAQLIKANLIKADINGIILKRANLNQTVFDENQIDLLYKKYDLSNSRVFIFEKEKIISYKEYCKLKHK